jgi:hypothetical protein
MTLSHPDHTFAFVTNRAALRQEGAYLRNRISTSVAAPFDSLKAPAYAFRMEEIQRNTMPHAVPVTDTPLWAKIGAWLVVLLILGGVIGVAMRPTPLTELVVPVGFGLWWGLLKVLDRRHRD